jgi:hypothetical protein
MKFTRVTLERELRADADGCPVFRRCHEHEILMSFLDDDGAYAFAAWWHDQGAEGFGTWCEEHGQDVL